ncbi:uncharacterized protein EAE97_005022 [Botrytis byssoidea]|uniref:Uncharacterized protein n=1 Tax=Botrytis byssoidea TaxID=139641 RepID=A0A9P5ILP0_9HELO|nr:uncharacterized protein EAE97_005022 [Botrytis byssoidea]KAF7945984.1 hypothetical protein EAE97_005022 [Botrytis byssoidea]
MSSQQILNGKSESRSTPPANSHANPKIRTGLHSLPMEILVQISKECMKEEETSTNPGNITRKLPKLITSLKCGVNDPWRRRYMYTLEACSKNWIYSLHFGNRWKLQMDSGEGELVQNIVIKYVPEIWASLSPHHSPFRSVPTINGASELNASAKQLIYEKQERFYYWNPLPEVVNSSLENLPKVRSIQLEFKTFCVCFISKGLGMYSALERFLDDHKDFKLKSATIEPIDGRALGGIGKRVVIPQVTVMAGHDVCFDLTDKGTWVLKAFTKQTEAGVETVDLDRYENSEADTLRFNAMQACAYPDNDAKMFTGCKWTWVLEREEK